VFRDKDLLRTQGKFHGNPLAQSHFYRLLGGWIDRLRGGDGARIITWTRNSEWPTDGKRRVSLQRYVENLDALAREGARRGAGMVLVRPVNVEVVEGMQYDGGFSWDPYVESQLRLAAFHDVPVVSALPPFQAAYDRLMRNPATAANARQTLFLDRMHPTALGQEILARAILDQLQTSNWPDNPLLGRSDVEFPLDSLPSDGWNQPKSEVGKQLSPFRGVFQQGAQAGQ